jgi:hypothetical protein
MTQRGARRSNGSRMQLQLQAAQLVRRSEVVLVGFRQCGEDPAGERRDSPSGREVPGPSRRYPDGGGKQSKAPILTAGFKTVRKPDFVPLTLLWS